MKILNDISSECYGNISYYEDNRSISLKHTTKYICGRIDGLIWLNKLIANFLNNKIIILLDLISNISSQKLTLLDIPSDDYNQGIYDQLDEMERKIYDRINNI